MQVITFTTPTGHAQMFPRTPPVLRYELARTRMSIDDQTRMIASAHERMQITGDDFWARSARDSAEREMQTAVEKLGRLRIVAADLERRLQRAGKGIRRRTVRGETV